jgi:hypothetical protein
LYLLTDSLEETWKRLFMEQDCDERMEGGERGMERERKGDSSGERHGEDGKRRRNL